jgi:hypothetical protein
MNYKCLKNNDDINDDKYAIFDNNSSDTESTLVNDKQDKPFYLVNLFNNKKDNIEHFGCFLGIGDCGSSTTTENLTKNTSKLNKKVNNSTLEKSVNNMVNAAMTTAMLKNTAALMATASAINEADITGNIFDGSNTVIDMGSQTAKTTTTVDNTVLQENVATISNDFSTQISNIIEKSIKDVTDVSNKKGGTNLGETMTAVAGAMAGVANNAISTAGSVFRGIMGGGDKTNTKNTIINDVNEEINIDNSVTSLSESNIKNIMETLLSAENIASAISDAKASNKKIFANNTIKGDNNKLTLGTQEAIATNITKSLINQVNKINIGNKVLNKIDKVLHTLNEKYKKSENVSLSNDLADVATGMVGIIAAGGDAAAKTLEAGGDFLAKPITAVGNIFGQLMWPLIIIGALAVLGIIVFLIVKKSSKSSYEEIADLASE